MVNSDAMADDLQEFIADCEWKTRKILRESNKRAKDSARLITAKERVELLKQKGGKTLATDEPPFSPLPKTSTPTSLVKETPAEWKGRDKIIHDACEVIKSFPADSTPSKKADARESSAGSKVHTSLHKSPFNDAIKCSIVPVSAKKPKLRSSAASRKSAEPAMVSRRTIERDFYIMSKKRSMPRPKRRQRPAKNGEAKPELKSSVIWKKYRCDGRIMEAKRRKAEKLYEKFERLKSFDGASDNSAPDTIDNSDSESSSSDEEKERPHAIHELLDSHVAEENLRSQKRTDKLLKQIKFKPDVQSMWDQLEQGQGNKVVPRKHSSFAKNDSQVQSVPLQKATKKYYAPSKAPSREPIYPADFVKREIVHYVPLYKEPGRILQLVSNEPILLLAEQTVPLTVSIYYVDVQLKDGASNSGGKWAYEIYDPCDGSLLKYTLSQREFDLLNSNCVAHASDSKTKLIPKVVHQQKGSSSCYAVTVSVDGAKISATISRCNSHCERDIDAALLEEQFYALYTLQVCEVLQLLGKGYVYSLLDDEFWTSNINGPIIWAPLIDILCKSEDILQDNRLSRSVEAYESLVGVKAALEKAGSKDAIDVLFRGVCQGSSESKATSKTEHPSPLLSMRISNHSPYETSLCPGHAAIGKHGIWRLSHPIVEQKPNSLFPVWPSGVDVKYPPYLDKTRASAFFYYKNLGPRKGVSVTALSRLAFESPVLAPYCFATDLGYIVPPFSQPKLVDGTIPTIKLSCKSLLECPVKSRFDALLPSTIVVLDPAATEDDLVDAPRDNAGNVFHVRNHDTHNKDGFRIKTFAHKIEYDNTVNSIVYGISEKAAIPNSPATTPFLTHKSTECCTEPLTRQRTSDDYHCIAESDGEGTPSEPSLFATHMKAYKPVFVSRKSIMSYRDEQQFLTATKEAEAKKLELALKIKAAEELAEARLKEKMKRIHQSVQLTVTTTAPSNDCSGAASDLSSGVPNSHGDNEVELPPNEIKVDESDELDQMAAMLLNNTNFLRAIARKLNLPDDNMNQIVESSVPKVEAPVITMNEAKPSKIAPVVPKLELTGMKDKKISPVVGLRGDGWKRLPRADTLIGQFKLTDRRVEKNRGKPKFNGFEGRRNFFAVNAVDEIQYSADPENFRVPTTIMFISDLASERLRLSKSQRQQKQYEKSLLSDDQKYSLNEILQIPVSSHPSKQAVIEVAEKVEDLAISENDATEHSIDESLNYVTRAILAVKTHNLQNLERILDTEGLSIETRDNHGNTLFILACQQGSKRLAKFLLRRGADINAQNNGGNTALHYSHEYHHTILADYLLRKGADDSIRNSNNLTVYEGCRDVNQGDDVDE